MTYLLDTPDLHLHCRPCDARRLHVAVRTRGYQCATCANVIHPVWVMCTYATEITKQGEKLLPPRHLV